ncbi:MAG: CmcJ/NvfI family oxidoreductase [Alphaproteobacteria bacterium]
MAESGAQERQLDFIEAAVTYSVYTGEKPVSASVIPGGRVTRHKGRLEEHTVAIYDARPIRDHLTLDRQGFLLAAHETGVADFYDEDELRSVYYPEIERLVKDVSGASRVMIFDHTVRSGDETTQEARRVREPVKVVHNDYTEWSGPQRVRDLLPADEAEALLERRFAVIQVWRPIGAPVDAAPLAICDAGSMTPADLIPAERRHPDRVGEIYHIAFNPNHRWYYFPRMQRNEALVFKCYDSAKDGRARFTAHGSFDDPTTPPDAPPRESIEMRTFAFFSP